MAKRINIDESVLDEIREDFEKELSNLKLANGKFSFTKCFADIEGKASITFEPIAFRKMEALVDEFSSEVAWHGLIYRDPDDPTNFNITDILVYPQEVSGTTVETDQEKYQMWLMELDDDTFDALKFQGHSHVNMSTSPSTTDQTWYKSILDQLKPTQFYVFGIWNKKGDRTVMIYDMPNNILYENKDITVYVIDDGSGIGEFVKDAKEKVVKATLGNYKSTSTGYKLPTTGYNYNPSGSKKKKKDYDDWDNVYDSEYWRKMYGY